MGEGVPGGQSAFGRDAHGARDVRFARGDSLDGRHPERIVSAIESEG